MKYVQEYRDTSTAKTLFERIRKRSRKTVKLMEFCGGHTVAIFRYGLRQLLPPNIQMLSGPGCPVCVTAATDLDKAIALAQLPGVTIASFGDMVRVPGSRSSLQQAKATGADVRIVYSAQDALAIARDNPTKSVIFIGIGFETTAPTIAASILQAEQEELKNYFVLSLHKTCPPIMKAILDLGEVRLDGIICPGHVSAVIGSRPYQFLADNYRIACSVSGFEPVDILLAVNSLVEQIESEQPTVDIAYRRGVKPEGNPIALKLMGNVFEGDEANWRGIGKVPASGLRIKKEYEKFDAAKRFDVKTPPAREPKGCIWELSSAALAPPPIASYSARCACQRNLSGLVWCQRKEPAQRITSMQSTMEDKILLAHGSGGKLMHNLIANLLPALANPLLNKMEDSAVFSAKGKVAFTTDSFIVKPLFFPGGDIGKLAVCGTVNDLAMSGARPLYLSLAFIIEEGLPIAELKKVIKSIAETADEAGVKIVTGDTKVVDRGGADKLFINTAGIGIVPEGVNISAANARPGDKIIISGTVGDHGIAVLSQREGLKFESPVISDCAPLNGLVKNMLAASKSIHCMRDPTRGGLATTLNDFAERSQVGIVIYEDKIPIAKAVQAASEMLGLEPLYIANEGKLVTIVPSDDADAILAAMQRHKYSKKVAVIGEVVKAHSGRVVMKTALGASRIIDAPVGELLPRIC